MSATADIATYLVEPYVLAGDGYAFAPHAGRGGWTWYTGSVGSDGKAHAVVVDFWREPQPAPA